MIPGLLNHRSSRALSMLAASGLMVWAGCSSSGVAEVGVSHPTMIAVAPETFLGDVPCGEQGNGLQRYVATLTDVTARIDAAAGGAGGEGDVAAPNGGQSDGAGGEGDFTLPSSHPVPCLSGIGFGFVVPGRHYAMRIEGYDTTALAPRAPGSPAMVTAAPDASPETIASAPAVAPLWSATCDATTAVSVTVVQVAHCSKFQPPAGDTLPSELRIPTAALLGGLECGDEPGQVERLSVSVSFPKEAARVLDVACGEDAIFADVPARVRASAYVSAFGADSTQAFAGASCDALTLPSASVTASCAKLSSVGTLRVPLVDALAVAGLSCNAATLSNVLVNVPGEPAPRSFPPPDCLQPFDHGFAAGAAAVTVTVLNGKEELASLTCHAEVAPGSLVVAICDQNEAQ